MRLKLVYPGDGIRRGVVPGIVCIMVSAASVRTLEWMGCVLAIVVIACIGSYDDVSG